MRNNDIKFSDMPKDQQNAMIDLFRDRSLSKDRSKSPIEEKIKRGQITGIPSNAVRRALEIQNGPRDKFEKASEKFVSPVPILRNNTQPKQEQVRDVSPAPKEMKDEDKETIQLTNQNKIASRDESLQKTQPRYDHKNAILSKFTRRTNDKINQRMKQRDQEDPVEGHYQNQSD